MTQGQERVVKAIVITIVGTLLLLTLAGILPTRDSGKGKKTERIGLVEDIYKKIKGE